MARAAGIPIPAGLTPITEEQKEKQFARREHRVKALLTPLAAEIGGMGRAEGLKGVGRGVTGNPQKYAGAAFSGRQGDE